MANETSEPRALGAALAAPEFVSRGAGLAMHVANRHVERWAPEADANRVRPLRTLGFVDRLVAPWIETAQRSASLRMFSQYARQGMTEREGSAVSWVFPRPWYQDELDWMAAARQTTQVNAIARATGAPVATPTMLTTRGTYVPPTTRTASAAPGTNVMPAALYEFIAPSLSLARPDVAPIAGIGYGGTAAAQDHYAHASQPYSPLVSLASVQAAQLVARMAPLLASRATPTLRGMLGSVVERASRSTAMADRASQVALEPTRLSMVAPELVTPPAPRGDVATRSFTAEPESRLADQVAEQHARIIDLQRVSRQVAQREAVAAASSASASASASAVASSAPAQNPQVQAARAEAEIRQRITGDAQQQRQRDAVEHVAAERARIEAQIAQRVTERTSTRRLHEQARTDAASHARLSEMTPTAVPSTMATPTVTDEPARQVPAEVLAAIAALPPELARFIGQRPERAMQAIGELGETLRATELLARSAAAGRAMEVTRGPRLVMPVGLGGLVSTLDRATSVSEQSRIASSASFASAGSSVASVASSGSIGQGTPGYASVPRQTMRMPSLPWIAQPSIAPDRTSPAGTRADATRMTAFGSTAFGSTIGTTPTALQHVAWADRWLARFAGATPQSLELLTATGAVGQGARLQALASASPGEVFVTPTFDIERSAPTQIDALGRVGILGHAPVSRASTPTAVASGVTAAASTSNSNATQPSAAMPTLQRFADDAETPDDVFAAISAAASQRRVNPSTSNPSTSSMISSSTASSAAASTSSPAAPFERMTFIDGLAHAVPVAPDAGMSAQLAASPFAAALRHLVPLASSRSFDVRALFGGELSTSFLAGLLASPTQELDVAGASGTSVPSWARALVDADPIAPTAERAALDWDPAYVAPQAELSRSFEREPSELAGEGEPTTSQLREMQTSSIATAAAATDTRAQLEAPLMTLRTALLSWQGGSPSAFMAGPTSATATTLEAAAAASGAAHAGPTSPLHAMLDTMTMPMLGDVVGSTASPTWGAPGMVGSRAHAWSVEQERSAADLSFDFVTPELVLAARVYGFGPIEAIQAARLAIAGPTQLTAMAGTVDRTFVQALAIEADRRNGIITAYPTAARSEQARATSSTSSTTSVSPSSVDASGVPAQSSTLPTFDTVRGFSPSTANLGFDGSTDSHRGMPPVSTGTSFGIERRTPRGAFLWPSAAVAALGLDATGPDGGLSMSVVALELLAAQAVAELGTYAALSHDPYEGARSLDPESAMSSLSSSSPSLPAATQFAAQQSTTTLAGAELARAELARTTARGAAATPESRESNEREVLDTVAALVPAARRARFDALYLALGQSTAGREWSPAARAARALALASRGEDAMTASAHERAATVWDVLPAIYTFGDSPSTTVAARATGSGGSTGSPGSTFGSASSSSASGSRGRAMPGMPRVRDQAGTSEFVAGTPDFMVDARPGLAGLSSRAGEALGSYVTAAASASAMYSDASSSSTSSSSSNSSSASSSSYEREQGAVLRAPTAAQEFVRTGRPSGRHGGGETEIPAWFEAAAKRMFETQTGVSEGISLAELTLVNSTPSNQIAASERAPSRATPAQMSSPPGSAAGAPAEIDVEKLAYEVYRQILDLMDSARSRNGEPYL